MGTYLSGPARSQPKWSVAAASSAAKLLKELKLYYYDEEACNFL